MDNNRTNFIERCSNKESRDRGIYWVWFGEMPHSTPPTMDEINAAGIINLQDVEAEVAKWEDKFRNLPTYTNNKIFHEYYDLFHRWVIEEMKFDAAIAKQAAAELEREKHLEAEQQKLIEDSLARMRQQIEDAKKAAGLRREEMQRAIEEMQREHDAAMQILEQEHERDLKERQQRADAAAVQTEAAMNAMVNGIKQQAAMRELLTYINTYNILLIQTSQGKFIYLHPWFSIVINGGEIPGRPHSLKLIGLVNLVRECIRLEINWEAVLTNNNGAFYIRFVKKALEGRPLLEGEAIS